MVSGACGIATSNTAALAEVTPPLITTQPVSQSVCPGNTATFSVVATGTSLSYQWYNSGGSIGGATSSSYTTVAAGSYYCLVGGSCGAAASNTAALTVNTLPSITAQPSNQTVSAGAPAALTVTATGTSPLSYQWQYDGANINGATSASLSISSASICEIGSYDCVVTNGCGSVTSDLAALNISGTAVTTVAAAKALSDGTVASLSGPAVTRSFTDFFYLEDADRSNAIKVNVCSGSSAAQGTAPTVVGTLDQGGQRVIDPAMILGSVPAFVPALSG